MSTVALITGATRGIGLASVRGLAALGIHVVLSGRDPKRLDTAVTDLLSEGLDVEGIVLDVTSEDDHRRALEYFSERHGRLDVLINNAAVWLESPDAASPPLTAASAVDIRLLRETFDANFFGPVGLTQVLVPLLRESQAGRIVNVSSIRGSLTLNSDPSSPVFHGKALAYDTSKAALNAFTIQLAYELRDTAIKVNALHPGWVQTRMGGSQADLNEVEGSRTSVRLASLSAAGPTGKFFYLDDELPW